MLHILEAGTDAATTLLFDPESLPPDFDGQEPGGRFDILRQLHAEHAVFLSETGSDGSFLLHAFVDEPIPPSLVPYLRDPIVQAGFQAPSGQIYFSGAEGAFHADDAFLQRHPNMGGRFEIPPGRYRLTAYRTEYPDDLLEGEFRRAVPRTVRWIHRSVRYLGCLAAVVVLVAAIVVLSTSASDWPLVLWVAVPSVGIPLAISRLPLYKVAARAWQDTERKYPGCVMEFRKQADG